MIVNIGTKVLNEKYNIAKAILKDGLQLEEVMLFSAIYKSDIQSVIWIFI
ncbi:hypothetical protein ACRRVD_00620 [Candidatus Cardinium hertigii]